MTSRARVDNTVQNISISAFDARYSNSNSTRRREQRIVENRREEKKRLLLTLNSALFGAHIQHRTRIAPFVSSQRSASNYAVHSTYS